MKDVLIKIRSNANKKENYSFFTGTDGDWNRVTTKGTHGLPYQLEIDFGSHSCPPSNILADFILE